MLQNDSNISSVLLALNICVICVKLRVVMRKIMLEVFCPPV